ncbi:hypothetical protein CRG98_006386 [Punica granatum]|uniref:Reverse transcriptase domain-containing protein n=1 Tax=Punica granatum TaxID=22663 RepID=A0A2I0KXQ4_PUNGR|nr:hypothetical protein CRG98_006386 [Punica granatum]
MRQKRAKSTIKVLYNGDEQRIERPADIAKEAVDFYEKLLGTTDPQTNGGEVSQIEQLLNFQLTSAQAASLIQPVSEEEIKRALWSMDGNKAPGPDGYSSHFFKTSWHIVGKDFSSAILKFFS